MKNKETNSKYPNFILYDTGIQMAFTKMCQNFQQQMTQTSHSSNDWVIIDNDTGQIITPYKNNKS